MERKSIPPPKVTYVGANQKPFRRTRSDTLQMHRIETQYSRQGSDNTKGRGSSHWALDMRGRDTVQLTHSVVMAEQKVEQDSETPGAQRGYMPCPTPRLVSPTWVLKGAKKLKRGSSENGPAKMGRLEVE